MESLTSKLVQYDRAARQKEKRKEKGKDEEGDAPQSLNLLSLESWAADKQNFKLVGRCHHLLSGSQAKGHLPQVSRQSLLSANDKSDNGMMQGLCTDLLTFVLRLRKAPENLS
jgi:hypothetical protein